MPETSIYKQRCADMVTYKNDLLSFGMEVNDMIRKYLMAMEEWVCGYNAWQLETVRFLGNKSKEVNSTGITKIIQRKTLGTA
ncbi:hypothetical protein ACEPAF_3102 [Sanghuangporus sanghuang]